MSSKPLSAPRECDVLGAMRGWICEQLAFLSVLLVLAAAFCFLIVDPGRSGRGTGVVAAALLLAAVLRGVLPPARAGWLVVRSRWVDVVLYLAMGGAILAVDIQLHA